MTLDFAFYGPLLVLVGGAIWLGNHLGKQPLKGPLSREDRDGSVGYHGGGDGGSGCDAGGGDGGACS